MKMHVLDTCVRTTKNGRQYLQGAMRGQSKNGSFLFIASIPGDMEVGCDYDYRVVFSPNGNYVLPY